MKCEGLFSVVRHNKNGSLGDYAPTPYGGTLKFAYPLDSWRCYAMQPCGAVFASCLTSFVRVFT